MSQEAKLRAKYGGALPQRHNMLTKRLMNKVNFVLIIIFQVFKIST